MRLLASVLLLAICSPALAAPPPAPNFTAAPLAEPAGEKISLRAQRGKVVLLDFWASWCAPCRLSLPEYSRMQKELGARGLRVLGVNEDVEAADGARMAEKLKLEFPSVHDEGGKIAEGYDPDMMPTSYLIDRQGRIRLKFRGFRKGEGAGIRSEIVKLLDEKQ